VPITRFVLRRLALGVLTLLVVSMLVFLLTHALGDPAAAVLGRDAQQPALLAETRHRLGLDRPLLTRYWDWLRDAITGDLGTSFANGRPIRPDLVARVENSLVLMAASAVVAMPLALAVGVRAARRRGTGFDRGAHAVSLVLVALPEFVLATVLVAVFSVGVFELLPAVSAVRGDTRPWDDVAGMVLPTVTLALAAVPYVVRTTRASLIEVLESDYVEMAELNGIGDRSIAWRHALPNAIGPTLQVIALSLAFMAGGVVVVEQVFDYPGVGSALVDAVGSHDVPTVQAISLFIAALYIACNTVADIGTVLVTPRLRTALP
jgi:peptide/nickel transport system permease protein